MIKYSLSLILLAGTLLAQESNSNDAKATLPELAVQGSSMGDLDLSRASILSGDTVESRKIKLPFLTFPLHAPNFYVNSSGQQSLWRCNHSSEELVTPSYFGDPACQCVMLRRNSSKVALPHIHPLLFDVEGVEVLKVVLRGIAFGKNSPGGVINIKSRRAWRHPSFTNCECILCHL